ncbi:MAG TPA: TlpA disulfide reductase family protein [Labilithrix sp.]|nr:TlpA disulfide reductase family protein [Labilithrix sp.]
MSAESASTKAGDEEPGTQSQSTLRAAVAVVALALGFALVPRLTKGCEAASLDEDAPNFSARVVANGEPLAALANAGADAPKTLELASLRGHPVVLDFWATWCGPCQAEAPIVNTIAQRYKDRGLAVVGVNTSDEDGLAARFVRKKGLGFPIVYDENNSIAKQYGVSSLPTLIVVSKAGKIVAVRHGVTSDSALDEIVRRYL